MTFVGRAEAGECGHPLQDAHTSESMCGTPVNSGTEGGRSCDVVMKTLDVIARQVASDSCSCQHNRDQAECGFEDCRGFGYGGWVGGNLSKQAVLLIVDAGRKI